MRHAPPERRRQREGRLRDARPRLYNHHPQHLLPCPGRHTGLRHRGDGSGAGSRIVSPTSLGCCTVAAKGPGYAPRPSLCVYKSPLFAGTSSGRCWVRTSDLCRVKEVVGKQAPSASSPHHVESTASARLGRSWLTDPTTRIAVSSSRTRGEASFRVEEWADLQSARKTRRPFRLPFPQPETHRSDPGATRGHTPVCGTRDARTRQNLTDAGHLLARIAKHTSRGSRKARFGPLLGSTWPGWCQNGVNTRLKAAKMKVTRT